jgi:CopG family nickel-responsive transcriptional regulator
MQLPCGPGDEIFVIATLTGRVTSKNVKSPEKQDGGAARFSVSADKSLLRQFDELRKAQGYKNRSLAVADMMRARLPAHRQDAADYDAAGTVTLVYDHHKPHIQQVLTDVQHDFMGIIVSTLHVHLDHHNCLETIVLKGTSSALKSFADRLIGVRGVKHGKLSLTSTGKDLPG